MEEEAEPESDGDRKLEIVPESVGIG